MKQNNLIPILILLLLVGCTNTEVYPPRVHKDTDPDTQNTQNQEKTHGAINCFNKFLLAGQNGQWEVAYQELSPRWQSHKTLQQFQENMEKEGHKHLVNAQIVQNVIIEGNAQTRCEITILHEGNEKDLFLLVYDGKTWKIDGLRILGKADVSQ